MQMHLGLRQYSKAAIALEIVAIICGIMSAIKWCFMARPFAFTPMQILMQRQSGESNSCSAGRVYH